MKNTNNLDNNDDLTLVNAGLFSTAIGLVVGVVVLAAGSVKIGVVILGLTLLMLVVTVIALAKVFIDKER